MNAFSQTKSNHRDISEIALDILRDWKKPYFGAKPYLMAMRNLHTIQDYYGMDTAQSIILYFLSNATTWRGEKARTIKKELKEIVKL